MYTLLYTPQNWWMSMSWRTARPQQNRYFRYIVTIPGSRGNYTPPTYFIYRFCAVCWLYSLCNVCGVRRVQKLVQARGCIPR